MENEKLALQVQQGNREALSQLWEAVRPLLFSMAWKFYQSRGKDRCTACGVTLEDLQQEAFCALCDSVNAYNPDKGYKLTTYFSYNAENRFRACMGELRTGDWLNYADRLETPARIPGDEQSQHELGETIPDEAAAAAFEAVDDEQEREAFSIALCAALDDLPGIQGDVLRHRFFYRHTRGQTAQALGTTLNEVRKAESNGLRWLRFNPRVQSLRDDMLETAAYRGTGWHTWYFERGSVEERLVESKAAWKPMV